MRIEEKLAELLAERNIEIAKLKAHIESRQSTSEYDEGQANANAALQAKLDLLETELDKQRNLVSQWVDNHAKVNVRYVRLKEAVEMKSYDLLISNYYSKSRGDPEDKSVEVCSICGQNPHKKDCKYWQLIDPLQGQKEEE